MSAGRDPDTIRRQLCPDGVDYVVVKYIDQLELGKGYSPHPMQARFITTALEHGATLEDVQRTVAMPIPPPPMHLHGHVVQVTEIDGTPLSGAAPDTVLVTPRQTVKVQLDAIYAGYWMLHCHLLCHQPGGMMTVLRYEGFENRDYNPLASRAEFAH
jgi:Multicopper oxidase